MALSASSASSASYAPSGDIDISRIDPRTHLFFDDKPVYITQVRDAITEAGIPLIPIHCADGNLELYDKSGTRILIPDGTAYPQIKSQGFKGAFRQFLLAHTESEIGNGITVPMIQQIIDLERDPGNPKKRIYFFDFDKLLSQVEGLSFAFGDRKEPQTIRSLIPAYTKYIFSDHIGDEPANGRLALLKQMFAEIGSNRIYIVTSNNFANDNILNRKTGILDKNPYKEYFIEILRELLPSFNAEHLICTNSKNIPPLFNNKGVAIVNILAHHSGSPKGSAKGSTKGSAKGSVSGSMGGGSRRSRMRIKVRRTRRKKYSIRKKTSRRYRRKYRTIARK
jgi:hypothetical protein